MNNLLAPPAALAATMTQGRLQGRQDPHQCGLQGGQIRLYARQIVEHPARSCEPLLLDGFEIGVAALEGPTI